MSRSWKKIVCGISGGVDSAVAAILLKRKGYQVTGLFMKNWDITDEHGMCSVDEDLEDAHFVCKQLKIPFYTVDFVKEYWNHVFSSFLQDYQKGLTPNPDILCNKYIKFDAFLKYAINKHGADAIATGHYARTSLNDAAFHRLSSLPVEDIKLLKAVDTVKDQTFFLGQLSQAALKKTLFPIGHLKKHQVRQIAIEENLQKIAKKKESMGICFIGSRNFKNFIEEYIEPRPGKFVDIETGKTLGQHQGIHKWTLGQRIHLGGLKHAYFVAKINPETQDIIVAPGTTHPALFSNSFTVGRPHWIGSPPDWSESSVKIDFRFQHIHPLVPCELRPASNNSSTYHVELSQVMRAISPGQYAVFYKGDECIGSAQIIQTGPSLWELNHKQPIQLAKEFS